MSSSANARRPGRQGPPPSAPGPPPPQPTHVPPQPFYPQYQLTQPYPMSPHPPHAPHGYHPFSIPPLPDPHTIPHSQPPPPQPLPLPQHQHQHQAPPQPQQPKQSPSKKRKAPGSAPMRDPSTMSPTGMGDPGMAGPASDPIPQLDTPTAPTPKKSRTNTPWSPAEENLLRQKRDQGQTWGEIAKFFPQRTEGSVKKHWYKDMHYAEFAEDDPSSQSQALLNAIKEYEANKWKVIGAKVGKPAKACEQYAREHFQGKI